MRSLNVFQDLLYILNWCICTQEFIFVPHHSALNLWVNVFLSDIQHSKDEQVPRHLRNFFLSDIQHLIFEQVPRHYNSELVHMTEMLTCGMRDLLGCAETGTPGTSPRIPVDRSRKGHLVT